MTFSVSRDEGAFEWAGTSLNSLFAQRANLLRPSFWRMIFDIVRFNHFALDLLTPSPDSSRRKDKLRSKDKAEGGKDDDGREEGEEEDVEEDENEDEEESIGAYLTRNAYSPSFINNYLLPMTACVWSTSPAKCALAFPAHTLVRFLWNHRLTNTVSARPAWLTIPGGAKRYVAAIVAACPAASIHLGCRVTGVAGCGSERGEGGLLLLLSATRGREGGEEEEEEVRERFDEVVLACHAPQSLRILGEGATARERAVLGAFQTTENVACLHSDTSVRLSIPLSKTQDVENNPRPKLTN